MIAKGALLGRKGSALRPEECNCDFHHTGIISGKDAERFDRQMAENENKVVSPERMKRIIDAFNNIKLTQ